MIFKRRKSSKKLGQARPDWPWSKGKGCILGKVVESRGGGLFIRDHTSTGIIRRWDFWSGLTEPDQPYRVKTPKNHGRYFDIRSTSDQLTAGMVTLLKSAGGAVDLVFLAGGDGFGMLASASSRLTGTDKRWEPFLLHRKGITIECLLQVPAGGGGEIVLKSSR